MALTCFFFWFFPWEIHQDRGIDVLRFRSGPFVATRASWPPPPVPLAVRILLRRRCSACGPGGTERLGRRSGDRPTWIQSCNPLDGNWRKKWKIQAGLKKFRWIFRNEDIRKIWVYKLKPSTPWGFLWVCASNGDTVHLSRSESWVNCG